MWLCQCICHVPPYAPMQTHVMPPDLAALLYAVIGNGDGQNNVPQLLKAVNELLMGRAGYPANAAARDSCKMAAAAVQAR